MCQPTEAPSYEVPTNSLLAGDCGSGKPIWARRWLVTLAIVMLPVLERGTVAEDANTLFEQRIRPVLIEHCYACHAGESSQIEGGLRLDSRQAIRRGGASGPAITPERLEDSLLISAMRYESLEMPPDKKLSEEIIRDFEQWVAQGAHDPRDEAMLTSEAPASEVDYQQGREFWSFQRPLRHALPAHGLIGWPQRRLDSFIASKLEQHQFSPAPRAESYVLLRRLAFDLTGLPPTLEQLRIWQTFPQAVATQRAIDELLSSSAFGEHWARLWLDIMRFAEDQAHIVGNDKSLFFPNSYLYRDWVIDALNRDLPYDRFISLQLAADLLTPDDLDDDVALGFIGLGPKYYRRNSPEVQAEEWEDRVDVLTRGLLALTVACARCHDHKYDPIGTEDYYALAGVFASTEMYNRPLKDDANLNKKGQAEDPLDAMHIVREVEPRNLAVMIRGDVNRSGPVVERGFLTVLAADQRQKFHNGSGRLELAREIASVQNPLTARVLVNRVSARLIGKPIVATPSNFGALGEPPTHPQLLDDLAIGFMEHDWSLKWLCREIVSSATYQQASCSQNADSDPQNLWLSHMHRKRLSVEQWRDAALLAAGQLDGAVYGPSIDPSDPQATRRSVYSQASRLEMNAMLALFDYPEPNSHSEMRAQTVSAAQKLFMMNSPFMVEQSRLAAQHIYRSEVGVQLLVERTYERMLSRRPTDEEVDAAIDFLTLDGSNFDQYIHALMMSNEALYLD